MKHCIDCSYHLLCDPADDFAEECKEYTTDPKIKKDINLFICPTKELMEEIDNGQT